MEVVVGVIIGLIFGAIFGFTIRTEVPVGSLVLDHSDPDEAYWFLEVKKDAGDLSRKKRVTLDVEIRDYVSRD